MTRPHGFTLIEISVVLLLTALLLAIAAPGLARLATRVQFNARLAELESGISALPRLAFALGEEGTLAELAARHLEIPEDWHLGGAESIYIRSSGICSGGELRIESPGGERSLDLHPPFCDVRPAP